MAPSNGASGTGRKRGAEVFDAMLQAVDTKKVPSYNPRDTTHEQAPRSAILSKEWKALELGAQKILELVIEPLDAVQNKSKLMLDLIESIQTELKNQSGQQIVVGVSGNMGGGMRTSQIYILQPLTSSRQERDPELALSRGQHRSRGTFRCVMASNCWANIFTGRYGS